ncbi:MAG: M23 family metallopeptidase [Elusimicrobiales bacterium]|nr:M23 family metallopeptidase [Elusimicrobiales bacterium]
MIRGRWKITAGLGVLLGTAALSSAVAPGISPFYYARFSVLTPPGPSEPPPEAFRLIPRLIHARHKVAKGENVRSLATDYGTDVRSLQSTNSNEFIFMSRGGYIRVYNGKGLLYEVTSNGETLNGIASRFAVKGRDLRVFKSEIVEDNGLPPSALLVNYKFVKGDRVYLPAVYIDLDTYRMPLRSFGRISSSFGNRYHPVLKRKIFHNGCDIPMPLGTPVYPSRSGTVTYSGWKGGYGNTVEVKHKDGSMCRYGHLSHLNVTVGEVVQKSKTMLGKVGSTGMSTGPHLHFEIITPSGKSVNPMAKIGKK